MNHDDPTLDQAILAARANPSGPAGDVVDRHRDRLARAITEAEPVESVHVTPDTSLSGENIDLDPIAERHGTPRRRHAVLAVAAAAALIVGAVALVNQQNSPTQLATEIAAGTQPDSPDPSVASDAEVDPLVEPNDQPAVTEALCGTEFPIDLVFAEGTVVQDGPLEAFGAVMEGQLVKHWTQNGVAVELRWPEDPKPVYGDATPATLATVYVEADMPDGAFLGFYTGAGTPKVLDLDDITAGLGLEDAEGTVVVSSLTDTADGGGEWTKLSDDEILPALVLGSVYDGTPAEGCEFVQARFVADDASEAVFAFQVTDPHQTLDLGPLVISQVKASETPTAVVACEGAGTEPGVPAFVDQTAAVDGYFETPIEAFQDYLDSASLPRSGYTEITHSAGVTYAQPFDDNSYTALVNVTNTADVRWAVTHVRTSGC